MALMSRILAPGIFGAEMEDVGQELGPFPAEEMLMEPWGQKRRRDFAWGAAARGAALSKLGRQPRSRQLTRLTTTGVL